MSFEEIYPIVKEQASYAVLRYEEPERRKDKIQELVCLSFEKYQRDVAAGKEIKKQDFKCFVTQRAKQIDTRSVCKKKTGGVSTTDVLGYFLRRSTSPIQVVEFSEWMVNKPWSKESVESQCDFNIDFQNWQKCLTRTENKILRLLIDGFSVTKISVKLRLNYITVRDTIKRMKAAFIRYFNIVDNKPLAALG
ncbi:hypothetical protein [Clostridium sp.]|uniref:helix-turn-helix transcriptional regulator n=1 Tax=Clostridium sp. TaxID=1506 RepID=UPI00284C076D|nr:hypothetical protein [Clostridium sp.]MDR3596522.1 hypothetical protein [Clostridium sp.]